MQRVVAGEFGGRRLLDLPSRVRGVRPSSSKVRGAIFDRLQFEVRGARVLDPFAGTGALAIEALSRGASEAVLFERQPALVAFLHRQLAQLGLEARARVVEGDAEALLCEQTRGGLEPFDLVLLDPPYGESELLSRTATYLVEHRWLADGASVVAEVAFGAAPQPWPAALEVVRVRRHGNSQLQFSRLVKEPP